MIHIFVFDVFFRSRGSFVTSGIEWNHLQEKMLSWIVTFTKTLHRFEWINDRMTAIANDGRFDGCPLYAQQPPCPSLMFFRRCLAAHWVKAVDMQDVTRRTWRRVVMMMNPTLDGGGQETSPRCVTTRLKHRRWSWHVGKGRKSPLGWDGGIARDNYGTLH